MTRQVSPPALPPGPPSGRPVVEKADDGRGEKVVVTSGPGDNDIADAGGAVGGEIGIGAAESGWRVAVSEAGPSGGRGNGDGVGDFVLRQAGFVESDD